MSLPLLFARIADLHSALRLPPMSAMPQPWRERIDDDWRFELNGTGATVEAIPPFTAAFYYRDGFLPAIMVDPGGGVQLGHDSEMERRAEEAIEARIRALGGEVTPWEMEAGA